MKCICKSKLAMILAELDTEIIKCQEREDGDKGPMTRLSNGREEIVTPRAHEKDNHLRLILFRLVLKEDAVGDGLVTPWLRVWRMTYPS
jgi:hypothetical protein